MTAETLTRADDNTAENDAELLRIGLRQVLRHLPHAPEVARVLAQFYLESSSALAARRQEVAP